MVSAPRFPPDPFEHLDKEDLDDALVDMCNMGLVELEKKLKCTFKCTMEVALYWLKKRYLDMTSCGEDVYQILLDNMRAPLSLPERKDNPFRGFDRKNLEMDFADMCYFSPEYIDVHLKVMYDCTLEEAVFWLNKIYRHTIIPNGEKLYGVLFAMVPTNCAQYNAFIEQKNS
jgi:hypothetical protein